MKRREFLGKTAVGLGAAWLGSKMIPTVVAAAPGKFSATDVVTLGSTGIQTTRLACGTGTVGFNHRSNQSALGISGLSDLLWHGYDQGLRFIDTADSYGTHPHVAAALKKIPREKVTVLTKSWARDAAGMRADLDRFRKELTTDYMDIVLMHCLTESEWPTRYKGAMDALSEARDKGIIRAHGVSCHSIGALRAAADTAWVQVDLARTNPILSTGVLDAFTIGAESRAEQEDLVGRISAVEV
jgi:diketogulonate reductase-like aldo/keto reductase